MLSAVLVGDDLTGTLDAGYGFAARDRSVRAQFVDPTQPESFDLASTGDVLAVDTDTRGVDPDLAAGAVRTVIEASESSVVYKKIDSTLRGNVVPEVDAALAVSGCHLGIIAPAFPATGRVTRDGVHYVDGEPLASAGYGIDESTVPAYFGTSRHPVEHLDRRVIRRGADAAQQELAAVTEGTLITCDATDGDHLRNVAEGAASLDSDVLYAGSGGLAKYVTLPGTPDLLTAPDRAGTGVLAVVGSVNVRTLEQLGAVPDSDIFRLDPRRAVLDPEWTDRALTAALQDRIESGGHAVLTAATDPSDVIRANEGEPGVSVDGHPGTFDTNRPCTVDPGQRVARALATAASTVFEACSPAGLFLTGGDVARATLNAIGTGSVCLTGAAVAEGIPEGWIADGPAAGTRVVTKAGGFGSRKAIVNCTAELDPNRDRRK
jgi:uncharacterized protein YgbK (DUF1537 family)